MLSLHTKWLSVALLWVAITLVDIAGIHSKTLNTMSNNRSDEPFMAPIVRPTNMVDLIKNCKIAFDKDILFKNEFFKESNLKKFFNGVKVRIKIVAKHKKIFAVSFIDYGVRHSSASMPMYSVSGREWMKLDENNILVHRSFVGGRVHYDPEFNIDLIRSMFGTHSDVKPIPKTFLWLVPFPSQSIKSNPHELGGKKVEYVTSENIIKKVIEFYTNPDGTIAFFGCYEEERL